MSSARQYLMISLLLFRKTLLEAEKAPTNTTVNIHAQVLELSDLETVRNKAGKLTKYFTMTVAQGDVK